MKYQRMATSDSQSVLALGDRRSVELSDERGTDGLDTSSFSRLRNCVCSLCILVLRTDKQREASYGQWVDKPPYSTDQIPVPLGRS
jgi:hypothetical protein